MLNEHKNISHVHHFCSSAMFISNVHLSIYQSKIQQISIKLLKSSSQPTLEECKFIISVHHKCSLDAFISPYFSWYSTEFNQTWHSSSSGPILNYHQDISHVHHFCSSAMFISHVHLSTEVSQNLKDFNQTWNLSFSNHNWP